MNSSVINFIKLGYTQSDGIIPMRRSCSKDSLLDSFKLRGCYLGLFVVIVVQTHVENEDYPYVAILIQTLEAT